MLQRALPTKEEYVLLVRMSPIQRMLYSKFMVSMTETGLQNWASNNPLKAFSVCCKVCCVIPRCIMGYIIIIIPQIWNHPDVLHRIVEQRKIDDNDLDLEGPIDGEDGKGKKGKVKGSMTPAGSKPQSPAASSPLPSDSSRPPSSIAPTTDTDAPTPTVFNDKKDQVITFEWVSGILCNNYEILINYVTG